MSEEASGSKRATILIGDDSPAFRLMARETLESEGPRVIEASTAVDVVETFERERPDLVLLDVLLPDGDGFDACEALRRLDPDGTVPIVIITARDHVDDIRRAYDAGATDFLTKPINWLLLSHRVRYMLRMREVLLAFRRSEQRLANAQRIAQVGSWEFNVASRNLEVSEELRRLYGFDAELELEAERILERVREEDRGQLADGARRALLEGHRFELEHRAVNLSGEERVMFTQGEPVLDEEGAVRLLVGTTQDVTERKRAEAQIRFLAYHDSLTRLGNRRLFRDRLHQELAHAARHDVTVAVMMLDVDHFKRINDTFGHRVGDLLIQQVAARLTHCVRGSDCVSRSKGDPLPTVSRLGGDEFMILLSDVADGQDAAKVARRVLEVLARPFGLDGQEVVVAASIGITIAPQDGDDVDTLLRNADAAMYHAKESGRNTFKFYERSMNEIARKRLKLEGDLRKAIEQEDLELHFQPKIEISTGRVTGFEALVRWTHPELGRIGPNDFIPVAEQGGLIIGLGEFVLRTACRQARLWNDAGFEDLRVSVNLSPHQFKTEEIVATVARVLAEARLSPRLLDLEITESSLMENEATAIEILERMKRLGISISLDDFGTGYSSLSYLKRFPVDAVKIDRSFVRDMVTDADDAAITATIVSMSKIMKLKVVAEGVETARQLEFLAEHGCDEMQGYLVSPPVSAEAATELLRRGVGSWPPEPEPEG